MLGRKIDIDVNIDTLLRVKGKPQSSGSSRGRRRGSGDDVPLVLQSVNPYGFLYKTAPRNKFSRNKVERPH